MLLHHQLFLLLLLANGAFTTNGKKTSIYNDDSSGKQIRLQDLEFEQEQHERQYEEQQQSNPTSDLKGGDLIKQPRLPIRYTWRNTKPLTKSLKRPPTSTQSTHSPHSPQLLSPSASKSPAPTQSTTTEDVYETAASSTDNAFSSLGQGAFYVPPNQVEERFRQLQLQHQQLSKGYKLPNPLPESLLLKRQPFGVSVAHQKQQPRNGGINPIVPYDDVLSEPSLSSSSAVSNFGSAAGIQYLVKNELNLPPAPFLAPPIPQELLHHHHHPGQMPSSHPVSQLHTNIHAPALEYGTPHVSPPRRPTHIQSNQYAFAPNRHAGQQAGHIPLPYPPSFISITTRRPISAARSYFSRYAAPFRPSQPDPIQTDFWATRESKSLIDSYIPSWEVWKLMQQQLMQQKQHQHHHDDTQQRSFSGGHHHTLAFIKEAPYGSATKLYKRASPQVNYIEQRKIVKKSLDKQMPNLET